MDLSEALGVRRVGVERRSSNGVEGFPVILMLIGLPQGGFSQFDRWDESTLINFSNEHVGGFLHDL